MNDWLTGAVLGHRISSVRGSMSQGEFAKRIGYSTGSVNRWENGHEQPRPRALRALAREFNVPLELFQGLPGDARLDPGAAFDAGFRAGLERAAREIDARHEPGPARYDRLDSLDDRQEKTG